MLLRAFGRVWRGVVVAVGSSAGVGIAQSIHILGVGYAGRTVEQTAVRGSGGRVLGARSVQSNIRLA